MAEKDGGGSRRGRHTIENEAAHEEKRGTCSIFCTSLFVAIISALLGMFRALWYVGIVSESFGDLEIEGLTPDPKALEDAIAGLSTFMGTGLAQLIWGTFKIILLTLGVVDIDATMSIYYDWNCVGVKAVVSWLLLLVAVFFVYWVLKREILFIVQIRWLRYRENMNVAGRMLFQGLTKLLGGIILYGLQLLVLGMYRLVVHSAKTLGDAASRGCNRTDDFLWRLSPILIMVSMFFGVLWYLQMMGGSNQRVPIKASLASIAQLPVFLLCLPFRCTGMMEFKEDHGLDYNMLFHSIKRTLLLTVGVWNKEMVEFYDVARVAAKYDDDNGDDDTRHQDVIMIYGRSRGLLWMIIPGCVILTQIAHLVNDPVRWEISGKLDLFFPIWLRNVFYLFQLARIVLTIVAVFDPKPWIILFLLLSVIPPVVASLIYHTHRALLLKKKTEQLEKEELAKLNAQERKEALLHHRIERRKAKHGAHSELRYHDILICRPKNAYEARVMEDEIRLELRHGPQAINPADDVAVRSAPVLRNVSGPPSITGQLGPPGSPSAHSNEHPSHHTVAHHPQGTAAQSSTPQETPTASPDNHAHRAAPQLKQA